MCIHMYIQRQREEQREVSTRTHITAAYWGQESGAKLNDLLRSETRAGGHVKIQNN